MSSGSVADADAPRLLEFSRPFLQGVAGFTAGAVSTALLHPLDLVKTRFQVDEANNRRGAYGIRGTLASLRSTLRLDGVRGLYRGLTANLAASTLAWGLYFWWYSLIKDAMLAHQQQQQFGGGASDAGPSAAAEARLSAGHHLVASALAGALASVITNPLWLVKTRMCAERAGDAGAYRSLWDGLARTYRGEGVRGLYRGTVPALFGVSHGALQFMAYEEMKRVWGAAPEGGSRKLGPLEYSVMAVSSKLFATVCTYPYQVVKARLQNDRKKDDRIYKGSIGTIRRIFVREGFRGFYKGLGPNLIRVLPGTGMAKLLGA
ncbi:hypothetical protein HK405_006366 [Cladochytrium tenue]|nr:hypothetical protein HK405_006366 [Cladochytrium tenue]